MAKLIGIAGNKHNGKDTAACMLNYIIQKGTKARYEDWYTLYGRNGVMCDPQCVVHFADYPKYILSNIFNIDVDRFFNNQYKDILWYCFDTKTFIDDATVSKEKYFTILPIHLADKPLCAYYNNNDGKVCIKLRTLMQYFSTDVMRANLGPNVWVNFTMGIANFRIKDYGHCIIPDVRFNNEAQAITCRLNGVIIKINREHKTDNHPSENIDLKGINYIEVDNNGTLLNLFYKLIEVWRKI